MQLDFFILSIFSLLISFIAYSALRLCPVDRYRTPLEFFIFAMKKCSTI